MTSWKLLVILHCSLTIIQNRANSYFSDQKKSGKSEIWGKAELFEIWSVLKIWIIGICRIPDMYAFFTFSPNLLLRWFCPLHHCICCSMEVNLGRVVNGCWSLLAHLGFQRALSFLLAHDVLRNPEYTSWKVISLSKWCTVTIQWCISSLLDDSFFLRMSSGQLLKLHHHIRLFPCPMAW